MGSTETTEDYGDVEFWPNPERTGWLTKQGEYIKAWRRRWFVLKQGKLFWFKESIFTCASRPRGVIPVASCLTVKAPRTFSTSSSLLSSPLALKPCTSSPIPKRKKKIGSIRSDGLLFSTRVRSPIMKLSITIASSRELQWLSVKLAFRDLEVQKIWMVPYEIVRFKNLSNNDNSSVVGVDDRTYVENSRVSESLLLMKFYSLSSGIVSHLLSNRDGEELDLPLVTLLINGRGQYNCSIAAHVSDSSDTPCKFRGNEQCAPDILNVKPNMTYRPRVASTTSLAIEATRTNYQNIKIHPEDFQDILMDKKSSCS